MIPPKKEDYWETLYPAMDPVERELHNKKILHEREIHKRRKVLEKIKPGDLVAWHLGGHKPMVGLVLDTKHETVDNTATSQPEQDVRKYVKIQWSQQLPQSCPVTDNQDWWHSLDRGYWKLLNR